MINAELKSLLARKLRTALTMLAIILGVSMISGTYVLTDTIDAAFADIFQQATANISAVVSGKALIPTEIGTPPPFKASLLHIIQQTRGVSLADGEIADTAQLYQLGLHRVNGKVTRTEIGSAGQSPSLLFGVTDQKFNELTLVSGSWPTGRQIALDESTMSRHDLHLGEKVAVVTNNRPLTPFTIVGETRFGNVGSIGGATLIDMDLRMAQFMTGKQDKFDQIKVIADHGVSQSQVVRNIRAALPPAFRGQVVVRTGLQQASHNASEITTALNFLTIALLAFAGVAVFVGAFIIFNTFSITVAQRAREFALFRTLGSSRSQVLRSVVFEALLIGLLASVIGLFAGLGVAKGLNGLFESFGATLPSAGLVLARRTVVVALIVGTLVTTVAALIPAIRATRVSPMAALREGATLPKGRLSAFIPYLAILVTAAGLLLTVLGIFASISDIGQRLSIIGLGCVLFFLGIAMFSPQLVRPLASFVGWPLQRFTAVTGRLARDNTTRNSSRTAITAAALMIGLALVAFVTIFAAELKRSADDVVNRQVAGALIVENSLREGNTIQTSAQQAIVHVPGVGLTSIVAGDVSRIRGIGKQHIDGIDPTTFGQVYRYQWKQGSASTLSTLGSHGALIDDGFASSNHLTVGSLLHVTTTNGTRDVFTVRGIFKASPLLSSVNIPLATFRKDWSVSGAEVVILNLTAGAKLQSVENRVTNLLVDRYPTLSVSSQQQFKSQQDAAVNQLLALIYVLLGLSIVVSLFGIINTLVLSIYERTREIGMLRAIGTTRTQVRWMIRWESVITSLIGAILGLVLGIVLAVLITLGLQSQGIEFSLPIAQLVVFLIFAIVFGIVAAAFPARRAARLDVLAALAYE